MQLFFNSELTKSTTSFEFDDLESKHIIKVLRRKRGDQLQITNGKGDFFDAIITDDHLKKCTVSIVKVSHTIPRSYWLHMVVAPTKTNERFEWFLEKATEIGVNEITPIICDRSERKIVKIERLKKVVQAAMKQSFQSYLPKVNEPVLFKEFLKQPKEGLLFVAHCEEDVEKYELKRRVAPDKPVTVLIGPEGDFSPAEIKQAANHGFLPVSMGRNRLRTETAGIVACATVAMINNG